MSTQDIISNSLRQGILLSSPTYKKTKGIDVFTKEDYLSVVREKRKEFVHRNFANELSSFFKKMKEEASRMRNCHFEVNFELPVHFDVNRTEEILRSYFKDLGYEAIPEPRKGDTNKIVLTLT